MSVRDEKIAPTAHYTAYVWHHLRMPYASYFATRRGAAMFWGFRALGEGVGALHPTVPSMAQYLEMRHRALEAFTETFAPDVVVELGAGLSRRGLTFAERGVRYLEADLAPMIALKRQHLARLPAALRARTESLSLHTVDLLSAEFEPWLRDALLHAQRPLVMAEGVLGYFTMAERIQLAEAVARALGGRGAFVAELRHRNGGRTAIGVLKAGIRLATGGRGAREDFETPEAARAYFLESGFQTARMLPVPRHLAHLERPARVWCAGPVRREA